MWNLFINHHIHHLVRGMNVHTCESSGLGGVQSVAPFWGMGKAVPSPAGCRCSLGVQKGVFPSMAHRTPTSVVSVGRTGVGYPGDSEIRVGQDNKRESGSV